MPLSTPLTFHYIDVRSLTNLPLISTLRPDDQESVRRFYHFADQRMALASNLLKYHFIHRAARVPWSEITISRTPPPQKRPIFHSPPGHPTLEFNVSHQAGLVALLGCSFDNANASTHSPQPRPSSPTPTALDLPPPSPTVPPPLSTTTKASSPPPSPLPPTPQLGIDITSPTELTQRRPSRAPTTHATFADYISSFDSAFSGPELSEILHHPVTTIPPFSSATELDFVREKMRRFSAFWALKEAYLKMTGEALVAAWDLRELEFSGVVPPRGREERGQWTEEGEVERGFEVKLKGRDLKRGGGEGGLRMELRALGEDFIVATSVRGVVGPKEEEGGAEIRPVLVDLERDVRACAEGRCGCLVDGDG